MRMKLLVKFEDSNSQEVEAVFADFVAWEAKSNKTVSSLAANPALGDLALICWLVLNRKGLASDKYQDWLTKVTDIEAVEEASDPKATSAEA